MGPFDTLLPSGSREKRFRIENVGDANLVIPYPTITDQEENRFSLRDWPVNSSNVVTLEPGEDFDFRIGLTPKKFTDFSIRFTPAKNTSAGITVVISTDDPKIPTFRFAVSGTGVEPGEDPLPPTRINRFALNGTEATITLVAETGKRFVVTTSSSLEEGSWTPFPGLEEIVGNGSVRTLRITDFLLPGGPAQRFIRLEELE